MARRIDPASPLPADFARLVGELAGDAVGHLEGAGDDPASAIHRARRTIKRLRALLRLFRAAAPEALKRCDAGFRDAAGAIAGPREAAALVETLERLIAAHPDRIVEARLGEIRAILIRRGQLDRDGALAGHMAEAARRIEAATQAALAVDLTAAGAGTLRHGIRDGLKRWEEALDRARRYGEADAFHDLRKAVKAHGAQLALLEALWPDGWRRRRGAVEGLGEALGELNDIHVMIEAVRGGALGLPEGFDAGGFAGLLRKERKRLARRALADADRLLASVPGGLARRFRSALDGPAALKAA